MKTKTLFLIGIIIGLATAPFFIEFVHGQTVLCYDKTILAIFQLNDIIPCLENKIGSSGGTGNATALNDLSDVVLITPSNGQILKFDGTNWINSPLAGGGNATVLNDLGDVIILSPSVNEVLKYNGTHFIDSSINQEATVCNNLGSVGELLCNGGNVDLKKLVASTGIALNSNGTRISIQNLSPEATVCFNVGAGNGLCGGGNVNIKSLIAGTGITITDTTDDWTIASTVVDTDTDKQVIQILCYLDQDVTKTNLPTTYTDVYTTAFDNENYCSGGGGSNIDFTNSTRGIIYFQVDFVGAGTNTYRWVDTNDNNNVLLESSAIGTDCDVCSQSFIKPSWLTGATQIEWQAKSSNGTNDPIMKGYVIMVK